MKRLSPLLLVLALVGCNSPTLPDPNDPNEVGVVQPDVLRNNIQSVSDNLFARVQKGEISDAKFQELMGDYANKLLESAKIKTVPADRAWEYADVFRTARRWKEAKIYLEIAVKAAKNEDRRVNDSLRLAEANAQLGDIKAGIALVRSTFTAPPPEKAPILISTLLEFVPAAEGKGHDGDLAKLLLDAIPQAEKTLVDPKFDAGAAYIAARPHHIQNAFIRAIGLYTSAGQNDKAREAAMASQKWEDQRVNSSGRF
jgi:hypothetical protein